MKPRIHAFLVHLAASAVMATLAMILVFGFWYPDPLGQAVGVTNIFLIILGVDVILGPLLTFIVYSPGKKRLVMDLAIIVALQLAAFGYGMWTVAMGRPVWLVLNVDRFDLVRAYELDSRYKNEVRPEFNQPSWFGPRWVAARLPTDPEARTTLTFESLFAGVDLPQRPDLYVPIDEQADLIRQKARPIEDLELFNSPERVQAVLRSWPQADAWLPMMAPNKPVTVLVERETAEILAVVDLLPWER